jgi:integrase
MFTYADRRPIRPEYLIHRFRALIKELDLPPIRLHDLRHGAATLALAPHTDLKVIRQMLGHSSIVTTADTYTNSRELHQPGRNRRSAGHSEVGIAFCVSGWRPSDQARLQSLPF